ncbi:MAG: DNA polymerase III subunit delta [Oscillospiraceae bacterium]|nr:DNA polymerase III subunit delta [Oscillospiraceae bacterium]MDD6146569.1 DNA polymerase III subunit delta [Oscillospiraceae bacterium]
MARMDEKELKAHIKSGNFYPVYLVCGNEDYLKKVYVDMIASKCVDPAFESFNLQKFDGKSCQLADVFDQAIIMPMMSDRRCVIVEDYKLEGAGEKDLGLIRQYLEKGNTSCVVVFHQKNIDFSLTKAKKAVEIIDKFGVVCVLDKRSGTQLTKPLISYAAKQGCTLSQQTANLLVSLVGDDYHTLINELGKICSYVGSGEITAKQIEAVAVKTDDAKIYYLTKALMQKDFDRVYQVLHSLIRQKIEPGYILGTIVSTYVDMYRAKVSLAGGARGDALAADFDYRKTAFRLSNAARDVSRMDIGIIRQCLEVLSEADRRLKSTGENPVIVLEQLMVRLFLVTNGERV